MPEQHVYVRDLRSIIRGTAASRRPPSPRYIVRILAMRASLFLSVVAALVLLLAAGPAHAAGGLVVTPSAGAKRTATPVRVVVRAPYATRDLRITLGSDCTVLIGARCVLASLFVHAAKRAHVTIGRHAGFTGRVRLMLHEAGRIEIGSDCLIAAETDVTVSDMHSIVDVASGKRVNPARDVVIGEHVWIGQRAMILKGSHIEAGSIVGAGSIVTGHVPPNSLAVGNPARVIRSGVTWNHKLL